MSLSHELAHRMSTRTRHPITCPQALGYHWINSPGVFSLLKYKASTTARQSNPNVTMGSVVSNYSFEGKTLQQIMEDMFFIYQAPTFATFNPLAP